MIVIKGKEYRNLEEQVLKNKDDIDTTKQLSMLGIKVVGQVETSEEIPAGEYDYGDSFLVGEEAPFDLYVWTRGNEQTPADHWTNLGPMNLIGPQGPKGDKGETGARGPQGPQGPQGIPGPKGDKGDKGETGQTGAQGPMGPTGTAVHVIGSVESSSQLPQPITLLDLTAAYLVGSNPYHLYIQVGTTPATAIWTDMGAFNLGDGYWEINNGVLVPIEVVIQVLINNLKANTLYVGETNVGTELAKVLKTPASTPSEVVIPTIDTNNAQSNVGLGSSLKIENGKLEAPHLYRHNITLSISNEDNDEFATVNDENATGIQFDHCGFISCRFSFYDNWEEEYTTYDSFPQIIGLSCEMYVAMKNNSPYYPNYAFTGTCVLIPTNDPIDTGYYMIQGIINDRNHRSVNISLYIDTDNYQTSVEDIVEQIF